MIGCRIRRALDETGTSVNALASATTIPRMTLTRRIADPSTFYLNELDEVAEALDVPLLWLLGGDAED